MFHICLVSENDLIILCDILKFMCRADVNQTFSATKIIIIKLLWGFCSIQNCDLNKFQISVCL